MPSLSSNTQSVRRRFSVLVAWLLLGVVAIIGVLSISSFVFADDDGNTQNQGVEETSETQNQYFVSVMETEHGKVAIEGAKEGNEPTAFSPGDTVTLTIVPDDGYYSSGLSLTLPFNMQTDESQEQTENMVVPFDGNVVDGKVTFVMPEHSVTVEPSFAEGIVEIASDEAIAAVASSKDVIKDALGVPDTQLSAVEQLQQMFGAEFDTSGVTALEKDLDVYLDVVTPESWEKNKGLEPNKSILPYIYDEPLGDGKDKDGNPILDANGNPLEKNVLYQSIKYSTVYDIPSLGKRVVYSPELQKLGGDLLYGYLFTGRRTDAGNDPYYLCDIDVQNGLIYLPVDFEDFDNFSLFILLANSNLENVENQKTVVSIVDENGNELSSLEIETPSLDEPLVEIPLPQGTADTEVSVLDDNDQEMESLDGGYDAANNSIVVDLAKSSEDKLVIQMSATAVGPEEETPDGNSGIVAMSDANPEFPSQGQTVSWSMYGPYYYASNNTYERYTTGHMGAQEAWCCDPQRLANGHYSGAATEIVSDYQRKIVYYCGPAADQIHTAGWNYYTRHHLIAKVINSEANGNSDWLYGISGSPYVGYVNAAQSAILSMPDPPGRETFWCAVAWTTGAAMADGSAQNVVVWDYIPYGYVKFNKAIDPAYASMFNEGSDYYTLEGTVLRITGGPENVSIDVPIHGGWGVGSDRGPDGLNDWIRLRPGTYRVQEVAAGKGCLLDKGVYTFNVTAGNADVIASPGLGGQQVLQITNKIQTLIKLHKDINPRYKAIYNSDPALQSVMNAGIQVQIYVDGNQGSHSAHAPIGDNGTFTYDRGTQTVDFATGEPGGGPITIYPNSDVVGHLYAAGCDEGKEKFGSNFAGWYSIDEIDKDPNTGMLFSYYVEPHDPVTGQRIYPCFQVKQAQTSTQKVEFLNIPLIPVDFYKGALDESGQPKDPTTLGYDNEVNGAIFRVWRAQSDSTGVSVKSPQPTRYNSVNQDNPTDAYSGEDLNDGTPFNGMTFDDPDTQHGVKSEGGTFSWTPGRLATTDVNAPNAFNHSIEDTVAGDQLSKYITTTGGPLNRPGWFRVYLLPPDVPFGDIVDVHGTYVLEEIAPPKDYLLPHGFVNGQLELIYPMFQLKEPFSSIPVIQFADEGTIIKNPEFKDLLLGYQQFFDDEEHFQQQTAYFRVFVDSSQEDNEKGSIRDVDWGMTTLYFGRPDYTKQVMTPEACAAAGVHPGTIGQGINDDWLFNSAQLDKQPSWQLQPAGSWEGFKGWYCLDEVLAPKGLLWPHDEHGTRLCPRFQILTASEASKTAAPMDILDMPMTTYTLHKSYDAAWDTHVVDSTHYTKSQENAKFHIFADPNQSDSNQHEVDLADASGVNTRSDLSSITVTNSKPSAFSLAVADPATGSMSENQGEYYSFEIGPDGNLAQPTYGHFHLLPQFAPDSTSMAADGTESGSKLAGHSNGVNWYTTSWTWPRDAGVFNGYYVIDEYQAPIGFLWPHDDEGNKLCQRFQVHEVMGLTEEMFEPGPDTVLEVVDEPIRTFQLQKTRDANYTFDTNDSHYVDSQQGAVFNIYAAESHGGEQSESSCTVQVHGSPTFSLPTGAWEFKSGTPDKTKAVVNLDTGQMASSAPADLHTGADGSLLEHVHLLPDGSPIDSVLVSVNGTYTQADPRYVPGGVATGVTKGFHGYYVVDEVLSPQGYMWPHDNNGDKLYPLFQVKRDCTEIVGFTPSATTGLSGGNNNHKFVNEPIAEFELEKYRDAPNPDYVYDVGDSHYDNSQSQSQFKIYAAAVKSGNSWSAASAGREQSESNCTASIYSLPTGTWSFVHGRPDTSHAVSAKAINTSPWQGWSLWTSDADAYVFTTDNNGKINDVHLIPDCAPEAYGGYKGFHGYYVVDEILSPKGYLFPHDDNAEKIYPMFHIKRGETQIVGFSDRAVTGLTQGDGPSHRFINEPISEFELQKQRDEAYTYDRGDDHYDNSQPSATFKIYAAAVKSGSSWTTASASNQQSEDNCTANIYTLPTKIPETKTPTWSFVHGRPDTTHVVSKRSIQTEPWVGWTLWAKNSDEEYVFTTDASGQFSDVHLIPDCAPAEYGGYAGFHGYYVIDEIQAPRGYIWPHDDNAEKIYPMFHIKRGETQIVGFSDRAVTGLEKGDKPSHRFINEPIAEFELTKRRDAAYTYDSTDPHFDNIQNRAIFTIYSADYSGSEQSNENCTAGTYALPTGSWTFLHGRPDKGHAVSIRATNTKDDWGNWYLWTKDGEEPYQFVTDDNGLIRDVHLIPDCAPAAYGGYKGFHGYYVVDEIQAPEGYLWPHADNAEKIYPMFHIKRGQTEMVGFSEPLSEGTGATRGAVTGFAEGQGDSPHNFIDEPYGEFALHKVENPNYLYTQDDSHYNRSQGTSNPGDGNTTGAKFRIYTDVTQAATGETVGTTEEELGWKFQYSQPDRNHALVDIRTGRLGADEDAVILEPDADGWIRDIHLLPETAPQANLVTDDTGIHQAEFDSEFANGVYPGFKGWYVIDEFETPQGYLYPHDDAGNQLFPRFHIARGEVKVVGWTEENANSDLAPKTENGTTIGVNVDGDNPHPLYNEPLAKFELHKLGDDRYTYIEGDEQTDEKVDGHFRVDQNGAVFNIYADKNQETTNNAMQTPSGSWKFDTGQPDWAHAVSDRALDTSDWRNWTLWTREGEEVHDFTTTDGGWIKDVHLIPESTPAKFGGYDGFHGYYVLDEVDCPTGYLVPHATDGAKVYPRFHVDRSQVNVSGFSDQPYSGNKEGLELSVQAGMADDGRLGDADYEHAFIDQPIGEFELNKKYNAEFDSMVKNGDGGEGDPAYDPTFTDATFNIYVDQNQGDVDGTASGPYWTVQAGTPDLQHALIDRNTGQMGPDTPETELIVLENNRTLKNGYLNLANEDGEFWIRDIHLLPGGAPDMSERTETKGTLQPGAQANIDTNLYTDLNHTFKGWYVIDEVIWPKGFMWPHASNGQKLYPRFQIAYDELDTVGYFGTGESGLEVDAENGAMGPFYDEAISVFNLHKVVDEQQQPPAGDKNYSSANPENEDQVNGINTIFKIYADTNQAADAPSCTPFEGATSYTTGTRDFDAVVVDRNTGRVAPDNYEHATNTALPDHAEEAEKAELFVVDENGWVKDIHLLPAETSEDLFSGMPDSAPRYHATAMRLPKDENGVFQGYYVLDEVQRAAGYLFPHDMQGNQLYPRFQVVRGQADPEFSYNLINEIQVPVQIVKTRDADYNEMIDGTDDEAEPQVSGQVREDEETQTKKGDEYYSLIGAKVKIFADQDQTIDDRLYGNPTKILDDGTIVSLGLKGPYSAEMVASEYGPYDANGLWYKTDASRVPGQMADADAQPIDDVYVFETQEQNGKAVINAYLLPSESSDQFFTNNGIDTSINQQTEEPTTEYPHGYSYGQARFQLPRDDRGVFNGYYVLAEVEAPSGYLRVHDANGNLLYPRFRVTRGQNTVSTYLYNEAEGHTAVDKVASDEYQLVVKDDEGKANPNYTLAGAKIRIYPDVDQKTRMGEEERPYFGTPDWRYAFYNEQGYTVDVTEYLCDVHYPINTSSDGEEEVYYQEVDEASLKEDTGIVLQSFVTDSEGKFVAHIPTDSGAIIGHPDFNGYYVVDEMIAPAGYLLPHVQEGLDKGKKLYPRFCVINEDVRQSNEDKGQVLPDLPYGGYDGAHEAEGSRNGDLGYTLVDDPARVFFSSVKVDPTMLDPNTHGIVFDPDTHDPIHNKNAALAGAQFQLTDSNSRNWIGISDRNGHVEFYTHEINQFIDDIQNDADLLNEYKEFLNNEEVVDFPTEFRNWLEEKGYGDVQIAEIPIGHFKVTEVANPIGFRVPEQPVVAEGEITLEDVWRYQKNLGDLYLTPSGSEFHYGNYDATDQRYWTEDESFTPTADRHQYQFTCTSCQHVETRSVGELEDGFTCPVCGADKDAFEMTKEVTTFDNNDLYKLEDIKAFDISLKKVKPTDYGDMDSYNDPEMQTPMKGVHFEIYRLNSLDDREGELVGTMVTGSDGVATTYNYPSGVEWDADPDNPVADWELYDRYGNCLLSRDQGILPEDGTRLWLSDGNALDSTLTSAGVRGALAYTLYGYRIHELPINVDDELRLAADIIIKPQNQVDGYTYQVGTILNYPVTHLQFIKVDQETGEVVPAAGFTFELYEDFDGDGAYTPDDLVTQVTTYPRRERVGQWTTDETGQVTMPAPLKAGKYVVHEVSCGNVYPYIISENTSVDFHPIHPTTDFEIISTEFPNKSAYGHIQFRKVDKDTGEPIEGAVFKIRAAEDIKRADGSVAVPEGSFVSCKGTDSAVITLVSGPDGTVKCCDGEHEDGCLPIDATDGISEYDLVEVKAADGYSLPDEPVHFQVKYENDETPDVMVNLGDIENEALKIQLTKASDEVEHMSLPGASYMLWDSGDVMEPVVEVPQGKQPVNIVLQSGNGPVGIRPHVGNGGVATTSIEAPGYVTLAPEAGAGESYVLVQNEQQSIDAGTYQVIYHASDVADETTVVDTIEVKTGDAINVKLDETGAPVIEQTSVNDTGLLTPEELEAYPGTYELALNPGVYDVYAGGQLVSETSPLVVTDSEVTYFAGDGGVPAGRWIKDLVSSDVPLAVETTQGEEGKLTYARLGHWGTDTVYHFAEVNPPDGYTVDHTIYEIRVGADNQPVFVEMTAAEQRANNQNLVVADGGRSLTVFDAPTRVQISKQDATTGEELAGAHLTVFDSEGNVVEEWVSGTSPHIIEGLKPGKYTLREVITPRTHEKANDVTFEVNDDGNVVEQVVMFDEEIKIDAEIDKRQEIANPPASDYEANGDGASKAETQINKDGTYDYSLDYRSKSTTWTDEFTVQDDLDMATKGYAYLEGITTAQGGEDYNGLMNVWYKTNKDDELIAIDKAPEPESTANATKDGHEKDNPWLTDERVNGPVVEHIGDDLRVIDYRGWHLWQADVPTDKATNLSVADLGLAKDEYVTGFRFEYGRVAKDFTTRQDRWNEHDPMLKNIHDDVNDVASQNKGTFKQDGKEVAYAPAQIHMRATAAYTGEARIDNSARVDAYRNGGVLPGDEEGTHYGDLLEGHDVDQVTQVPKSSDVNISGKLDKRQEIADPTADRTEANGDGKNTAATTVSEDGFYDYSLDFVNTSSTWVDEFTITDSLDAVKDNIARLTGITTPKASEDFDGLVNVWYKTKASSSYDRPDSDANQTLDDGHVNEGVERQLSYAGYRLWKAGVSLSKPEVLNVSDLNILDGDYVTDIRFEFGRVEPGFTSRTGLWDRDDLYSEHDDVADVPSENEEGYAPIIVHMQVTPDYVEGKPLNNSAVLDLYRLLSGSVLGGHDKDAVTQTPKLVVSVTPGTPSSDVASYKVTSLLDTGIPALMVGFAAIGGIATITYTIRRVRNRNRE